MNPRLLRPLASGFRPSRISNIVAWWDFADASSLFSNLEATTLANADDAVAVVKDKSTNARNLTQSTLNNRPLRKTAILNGKDVLRFDGSNDQLVIPDILVSTWTSYCMFTVARMATAGVFGLVDYTRSACWGTFFSNSIYTGMHFNTGVSSASVVGNTFYSLYYEWTGSAVRVARNETLATPVATSTALSSGITAGSVGALHNNTFFLNGDIGEVIIYNRNLTGTERASVFSYLRTKWNMY
jgi:hypothetical protein